MPCKRLLLFGFVHNSHLFINFQHGLAYYLLFLSCVVINQLSQLRETASELTQFDLPRMTFSLCTFIALRERYRECPAFSDIRCGSREALTNEIRLKWIWSTIVDLRVDLRDCQCIANAFTRVLTEVISMSNRKVCLAWNTCCNSFKSGQIAQAVLWIESNMNVRSLIYGFARALWFCSLEIARSQAMISTRTRSGWVWTSWRQS